MLTLRYPKSSEGTRHWRGRGTGGDEAPEETVEYALRNDKTIGHPGPPWFHWHERGGHLEYQVQHQGKLVQCPYIRYMVHHRVPYEMGTEGTSCQRFAREVFVGPQSPVEAPGVEDNDLDIFTRDIPFNFAVEQALEKLDDPSALAEVARLRSLSTRIPMYSELIKTVQDLSKAMHKFHNSFNDRPVNWSFSSKPRRNEWKTPKSPGTSGEKPMIKGNG